MSSLLSGPASPCPAPDQHLLVPTLEIPVDSQSLFQKSATELAALIAAGEISSREVVESHVSRISQVNDDVNAIVTLTADAALAEARRADEAQARGEELGPLHGIPVVHKDLHDTAGVRTTYGSTLYAEHVPLRDALGVQRLKRAGAISLGKTNTPEFGTGSQTYNGVFGVTRNPYDLSKTAGGSSGGSAAALAARMVPLADGTDMGGSLRNPASFCNVVGFRPSAGLVPTGPSSTAWASLAVEGPMARTVQDVALMLSVIAGYDPSSPLSWPVSGAPFRRPLDRDVQGLRVAWGRDLGGLLIDPQVREVLERCGRPVLEALGCSIVEAEPDFTGAEESFRTQRAWSYAAWFGQEYADHRAELNPDTAWNIECGLKLSGADLIRAEAQRSALYQQVSQFFGDFDVLALPVAQVVPFPVEEPWVTSITGIEQHTYLDWMRSAYFISATGMPAISLPCGFTPDGLPVGIQLVGRPAGDFELLQVAHAFEAASQVGQIAPGDQPGASSDALTGFASIS